MTDSNPEPLVLPALAGADTDQPDFFAVQPGTDPLQPEPVATVEPTQTQKVPAKRTRGVRKVAQVKPTELSVVDETDGPEPRVEPVVRPRSTPHARAIPEPVTLVSQALELASKPLPCLLCSDPGGELVAQFADCRVIRAKEAGFPAFYRVIWSAHVAEWTDLTEAQQVALMRVVGIVERTLREMLQPTKINLASLGNVVPHLHWHVVARFDWDSHFPAPIWGAAQRSVDPAHSAVLEQLMPQVDAALRQRLLSW